MNKNNCGIVFYCTGQFECIHLESENGFCKHVEINAMNLCKSPSAKMAALNNSFSEILKEKQDKGN